MDELPATPAQLAANPKGGTDAIEGAVEARLRASAALDRLATQIDFALAGYESMVPRARAEVDRLLLDWREAHRAHRAALTVAALRAGAAPDGAPRWAIWVQRLIVGTRAWTVGIGRGALGPVVRGEERTLDLYDDAAAAATEPAMRDLLEAQRAVLVLLHNRTRDAV